jgi:CheY-like chemotaxis protein
MDGKWHILVVDDEPDMQAITKLALKSKTWKDRGFALTFASSSAAARQILEAPDCPPFAAALIDVIMETDDAGLKLCDFIKKRGPRGMQVILRTGQPGNAHEAQVMREFGIRFFVPKGEATERSLFEAVCAAIQSGGT